MKINIMLVWVKDVTILPYLRTVRNIGIKFWNHITRYANYCNQRKKPKINEMEITMKISQEKPSFRKTNYIKVSALGLTYFPQRWKRLPPNVYNISNLLGTYKLDGAPKSSKTMFLKCAIKCWELEREWRMFCWCVFHPQLYAFYRYKISST